MGADWLPYADRDTRWSCNTMSRNTPSVRAVLHTTENSVGTDPWAVADYMASSAGTTSGYHLLVPLEGGHPPLQLRPASCAAGSLRNSGETAVSPNKQGTVLIAVSLVARAGDMPATRDLGPWWPDVIDWLRGWGVPDRWLGPYPPGGGRTQPMSLADWYSSESGWVAHATVPRECNASEHWDPGVIDVGLLWPGTVPEEDDVPLPWIVHEAGTLWFTDLATYKTWIPHTDVASEAIIFGSAKWFADGAMLGPQWSNYIDRLPRLDSDPSEPSESRD